MSAQYHKVFERLYRSARKPEDLPWHSVDPPSVLLQALGKRQTPGTALDVGCGAGTFSVYLAQLGYNVTAVDFMPQAIEMLTQRVQREKLSVKAIQADVTKWQTTDQFELVLDVGCLHSLPRSCRPIYKTQLMQWLAPGGDFVLVHLARRNMFDWWPVGPNRVAKDDICRLFAPDLSLESYQPRTLRGMPLFMGMSALVGQYWFQRTIGSQSTTGDEVAVRTNFN